MWWELLERVLRSRLSSERKGQERGGEMGRTGEPGVWERQRVQDTRGCVETKVTLLDEEAGMGFKISPGGLSRSQNSRLWIW